MDPTHHPSPLEDAPRSLGDSGVSPAASVPNAATHPRAGHVAIGGIGDSPASLGAEALAPLFPPASRSAAASSGDSPAAQPSTNISPVENPWETVHPTWRAPIPGCYLAGRLIVLSGPRFMLKLGAELLPPRPRPPGRGPTCRIRPIILGHATSGAGLNSSPAFRSPSSVGCI